MFLVIWYSLYFSCNHNYQSYNHNLSVILIYYMYYHVLQDYGIHIFILSYYPSESCPAFPIDQQHLAPG